MVRGTKRALLVGCSYYGTVYEREYGTAKDVEIIEHLVKENPQFKENLHFKQENITVLLESKSPESENQPTLENIENELRQMMNKAEEGDVLFFYFSGLGQLDQKSNSPAIISCNLQPITAVKFRSIIIPLLPSNASFTFVCEASNSGNFLEPPVQVNDNKILLSAGQDDEIAHRDSDQSGTYGVFTNAIRMALNELPPPVTNENLFTYVTNHVKGRGQHPRLVCNVPNNNAPFLGFLIN